MTTAKQIIIDGIEKIKNQLYTVESYYDIAQDYMQEVLDDLKINDEVSDFILSLVDDDRIPTDIQDKAGELWQKI